MIGYTAIGPGPSSEIYVETEEEGLFVHLFVVVHKVMWFEPSNKLSCFKGQVAKKHEYRCVIESLYQLRTACRYTQSDVVTGEQYILSNF